MQTPPAPPPSSVPTFTPTSVHISPTTPSSQPPIATSPSILVVNLDDFNDEGLQSEIFDLLVNSAVNIPIPAKSPSSAPTLEATSIAQESISILDATPTTLETATQPSTDPVEPLSVEQHEQLMPVLVELTSEQPILEPLEQDTIPQPEHAELQAEQAAVAWSTPPPPPFEDLPNTPLCLLKMRVIAMESYQTL